jgi:DnaJ-class molecular chaperone
VTTRKTCGYCDGSKIFIKYKCLECHGTGATIHAYSHK